LLILVAGCSKPAPVHNSNESQRQGVTGTATIRGVIHFEGTPPVPAPLDASQDPNCAPNLKSESLVADQSRLQNVYIYVKSGWRAGKYSPPAIPVVLDQRGCRYLPHVLAMMVGQKLQIANSDPTMHNVNASTKINEGWNLSQSETSPPAETTFNKPELLVPVQCNVHPWMKAYIHVSEHPFFAVSRHDGTYEIGWLPPGTYTVAALHEKLGEKTQHVIIREKGETVLLDFSFNASDSR
jgi:plastocyanin